MKLTKKEIMHVAALARLDLSEQDAERFTSQVGDILGYVEKLSNVDTKGVKSTSHAIDRENAFRQDEVRPSMGSEAALENAPEKEDKDILVPRVI